MNDLRIVKLHADGRLLDDSRAVTPPEYSEKANNFWIQAIMPRYNVIFESQETIYGVEPYANDVVKYKCILKVKDGGKMPVSLDMVFVPPHPYAVNMPLEQSLKAESISALFAKVVKFLAKYGIEF